MRLFSLPTSIAWIVLCVASVGACGSDDNKSTSEPQAGNGAAGGGGSKQTGGSGGGGASGQAQLGAACKADKDCAGGYFCDAEMPSKQPVVGAPGGTVDQFLFPGGSCTPKRATTFDQTNPSLTCAPNSSDCGADGVCTVVARSSSSVLVGCRKKCDPAAEESGCRTGYQCGFTSEICTEGCQMDIDCRIVPVDTDNDGENDAYGIDSASDVTCDTKSGRCVHPAGSQASGASCMRDDDCAENGLCIPDGQTVAGQSFPGGYCTLQGCDVSGHQCDNNTKCEALRPWNGASGTEKLCFEGCKVGAEAADLRTGEKGHGEGCREGYRCHYNGGPGADSGVCVGGNYNAVTKNNVGAGCKVDSDCYSPYGLGSCAVYRVSDTDVLPGICTINDCFVPGISTDVCGDSNECVSAGQGDETNCLHHCKDATECPTSFACTDDDMDTQTPKNCIPLCLADADCKPKEKCVILTAGQSGGLCQLQ